MLFPNSQYVHTASEKSKPYLYPSWELASAAMA